jgi:hypothetical protein
MNNDPTTAVVLLIEKYKKQMEASTSAILFLEENIQQSRIRRVLEQTNMMLINDEEKLKGVIEDLEELKDVLKKQRY